MSTEQAAALEWVRDRIRVIGSAADLCPSDLEHAFTAGAAWEREACAKLADTFKGGYTASLTDDCLVPDKDGPWSLSSDIAAAIRGRAEGRGVG